MSSGGRRAVLAIALLCALGACEKPTPAPQSVTAMSVQGNDTAFTTMRPLPSAESLAALSASRAVPPAPATRDYAIRLVYDGARAQVVITSPDGQIVRDTTRPRDTSCDDFAPDTSSDPSSDGI